MRKKRIFYVCALSALAAVTWYYGAAAGALVLVLFLAGLAIVVAKNLARSRAGLARLAQLQPTYGHAAMIANAKALAPANGRFTFVVLGDSRKRMKTATRVFGRANEERPLVIFHTGDIVRGGAPSEYLTSLTPLVDLVSPVPVLFVPGNHERGAWRDFAAYRALLGGDRWSFELGPCFFAGLNNSTRAGVTDEDLTWLDGRLSESAAAHKFVFFHIPPAFFEARFATDTKRRGFTKNADALHASLVRHRVDEVFMAHIHGYATEVIDGVRYTLTAGAGASLSARVPESGRYFHYLCRSVGSDAITREMVKLQGTTWSRVAS